MIPWLLIGLAGGLILGVVVTLAVCAAMSAGRHGGLIEFQPTTGEPAERDEDDWFGEAA